MLDFGAGYSRQMFFFVTLIVLADEVGVYDCALIFEFLQEGSVGTLRKVITTLKEI